jgi:hypothetical protein
VRPVGATRREARQLKRTRGGTAKSRPITRDGEGPREGEAQEGIGRLCCLTVARSCADSRGEEGPEDHAKDSQVLFLGSRGCERLQLSRPGREQAAGTRSRGQSGVGKASCLLERRKPLKGGTPGAPPGGNKPGRQGEEEAVRRVRNPGDGPEPGVGKAGRSGLPLLDALKGREPHERCGRPRGCSRALRARP